MTTCEKKPRINKVPTSFGSPKRCFLREPFTSWTAHTTSVNSMKAMAAKSADTTMGIARYQGALIREWGPAL